MTKIVKPSLGISIRGKTGANYKTNRPPGVIVSGPSSSTLDDIQVVSQGGMPDYVSTIALYPGTNPTALAIDSVTKNIWVGDVGNNNFYKYTASTDLWDEQQSYPGSGPRGVAVNSTNQDVWIADSNGSVYKLTGGSGAYEAYGTTPVSAVMRDIDVNESTGDVWVVNGNPPSDEDSILKLDGGLQGGTFNVVGSWPGASAQGIEVNSTTGDVWTTDLINNGVLYKLTGGTGTYVATGTSYPGTLMNAVSVRSANNDIWVCNSDTNQLYKILKGTDSDFAQQGDFPGASDNPTDVSIDNDSSNVWVSSDITPFIYQFFDPDRKTTIVMNTSLEDAESAATALAFVPHLNIGVFTNIPGYPDASLSRMALDFRGELLWMLNASGPIFNKMDTSTDTFLTPPTFSDTTPVDVSVDGLTGDVWTASQTSKKIWINIGGTAAAFTEESTFVVDSLEPRAIAIDQNTKDLWILGSDLHIYKRDGGDTVWHQIGNYPSVATGFGELEVHADTGRLWIVDETQDTIFYLNSGSTNYIEAPFAVGINPTLRSITVDQFNGNIYATDFADGNIYRLLDVGARWNQVGFLPTIAIGALAIDPSGGDLYIGDTSADEVYLSPGQSGEVIGDIVIDSLINSIGTKTVGSVTSLGYGDADSGTYGSLSGGAVLGANLKELAVRFDVGSPSDSEVIVTLDFGANLPSNTIVQMQLEGIDVLFDQLQSFTPIENGPHTWVFKASPSNFGVGDWAVGQARDTLLSQEI